MERVSKGQILCNYTCKKSTSGAANEEGGMEGVCYIFVIDLNHGYVIVNYELAKYIVKKSWKGSKLVNKDGELCKRSIFGYSWGRIGRGVLTFSDRPQPWLYFWQKYKLTS